MLKKTKMWLVILVLTLLSLNVFANKGDDHNHIEKHTSNTIEPATLNIRYSPTHGVSGDTSFKIKYSRSGDGGTFCKKITGLRVGRTDRIGDNYRSYGDPISFVTTNYGWSYCTFNKTFDVEFIDANYPFRNICKDNNGQTLSTSFLTYMEMKSWRDLRDKKTWVYNLRVPVRLECACVSPRLTGSAELQTATTGAHYSTSLSTRLSGGAQPVRYSLNGAIPPGTGFNVNGTLGGTPTVAGDYTFSITAQDSCPTGSENAQKDFQLQVCAAQSEMLSNVSLPNGYTSQYYRFPLQASGTQPIRFSVLDWRDLPEGVTLHNSGLLLGTPTNAGLHHFTIKTEDACGKIKETRMTINVESESLCQALAFESPQKIPEAQVNKQYVHYLGVSGGGSQLVYRLKSGSVMPSGLSTNNNGRITGQLAQSGYYSFGVEASSQCLGVTKQVEKVFSLKVYAEDGRLPPARMKKNNYDLATKKIIGETSAKDRLIKKPSKKLATKSATKNLEPGPSHSTAPMQKRINKAAPIKASTIVTVALGKSTKVLVPGKIPKAMARLATIPNKGKKLEVVDGVKVRPENINKKKTGRYFTINVSRDASPGTYKLQIYNANKKRWFSISPDIFQIKVAPISLLQRRKEPRRE